MAHPVAEALKGKFPDDVLNILEHQGQTTVEVKRDHIVDILRFLKDEQTFVYLSDICALDFSAYQAGSKPERFATVYNLYSFEKNDRIRVRAFIPETDPTIDSAAGLFDAANWGEREAWDMMGIKFKGHPDVRRILLPENYGSHPHRKEYPVTGRGERDNFPKYYE
jgi:NADH-quinone oxidoreductase subunit C